jgi:hypothetical protein
MNRIPVLILAAALVFGTACAGSDGISDVVGPNIISDGRDLAHRATNNGWTSTQANALIDELVDEIGVPMSTAVCLKDHIVDAWSVSEWMATTGNEPEIATMLRDCA